MNNTINSGLSSLLNELNPRINRPQSEPSKLSDTSDKGLADLLESSDDAQSVELEKAVAKIINRLLDSIKSNKGTASLSEQAKNTPLSKNIFKDMSELITRIKDEPQMQQISAKLESLLNPKDAKQLEASLANSGVFYESKLRASLNKEILPKSFFRLINFMKNIKSPQLKQQIFALSDDKMNAMQSLAALKNFIDKELKASKNETKNQPNKEAKNSEQAQANSQPNSQGKASLNAARSNVAQLNAKAAKSLQKKPSALDNKQIIKLAASLEQAQKYLAKSPHKAPQIARQISKQLDRSLLTLLENSPNLSAPKKLAALKSELEKHFKSAPNQQQNLLKDEALAPKSTILESAKLSDVQEKLDEMVQEFSSENEVQLNEQESKPASEDLSHLPDQSDEQTLNEPAYAEDKKLILESKNSTNEVEQKSSSTNQSAVTNQGAAENNKAATNQNAAAQSSAAQNTATSTPLSRLAALPPQFIANKPGIESAFSNAAALLSRADTAQKQSARQLAAQIIDEAINALKPSTPPNAGNLANKIKSVSNMLNQALKGEANFEKALAVSELKQLKSLLNTAASAKVSERSLDDVKKLADDSKALLLKAHEIATSKGDNETIKLTNKLIAQIELNQLISASSAQIFTHLPYDFSSLEHASVGFRADGDDKFSAAIKLDFKYLGKINVMLALESEKYLQINIMVQNPEFESALIEGAASFKQQLRKAGLIVGGFFISRLKKNDYESDEFMDIGLDLRI